MNDEQLAEVLKRVDALAAKVGVGAEVLWGALMRQAAIDSCVALVIAALLAACWLFYCTKLIPFARKAMNQDEDEGSIMLGLGGVIIGGLLLMASSMVMIFNLDTILAGFFNPEYWAFQKLMRGR